jgi:hypothetical protein
MMVRPSGLAVGMLLYMVVMTGAVLGLHVGYQAPTAEEAYIEYNGTHLDAGGEVSNLTATDAEPPAYQQRLAAEAQPYLNWAPVPPAVEDAHSQYQAGASRQAERGVRAMFHAIGSVGDTFATIGYTIRPWMPAWIVNGALSILNLGVMGAYAYVAIQRVREVAR